MTTIRLQLAAAALAGGTLFAADVSAQALPQAWTRVADSGESASVGFMEMSPGWHLGPGPAGLVYQEDHVLGDTFRVEYEAHAFAGDPAAFGVFFGGRGLRPESYDFFEVMLDTSGRYSLGHRAGPEYHEVVAWTEHEAVRVPTAAASALNRLSIDVSPARLAVSVNGVEVVAFPPPEYARFDGTVGLRVGDGANVHVTRFEFRDGVEAGNR